MELLGKKETLISYLEKGIAMIHLDARRAGVVVPSQHVEDPHLRLNLSYRYGIPDLVIDDVRVQATLSFRGRPFQCQMPWEAVFGITSQTTGDGQVWPEDLPGEVVTALSQSQGYEIPDDTRDPELPGFVPGGAQPTRASKPRLVAIDGARPVRRLEAAPDALVEPREPDAANASGAGAGAPSENVASPADDRPPTEPGAPQPERKSHLRIVR
jgi:stringent starvation protein B